MQEKRSPESASSLDMFTSPRRRPRRASRVEATGAVEFRSVEALHQVYVQPGLSLGVEVRVLFAPSELRWSSIQNRLTRQVEQVPVMTVVLADRTGPILFEVWREQAEKFHRQLLEWGGHS